MAALDIYLATAPRGEVVTAVTLTSIAVGFLPFFVATVIEHVAAVRGAR